MASRTLLQQFSRRTPTSAFHPSPFRTASIPTLTPIRLYSSSFSVEPPDYLDAKERHIFNLCKESLSPSKLEVQDISGGCGSMYAIDIISKEFQGLSVIKQHRLVNKILGEEIKKWHGVQLKTRAE